MALAEANAEAAVRKIVDGWPPLSAETKAELAVIILSGADRTPLPPPEDGIARIPTTGEPERRAARGRRLAARRAGGGDAA